MVFDHLTKAPNMTQEKYRVPNLCSICFQSRLIEWALQYIVRNLRSGKQSSQVLYICDKCWGEQSQLQELGETLKSVKQGRTLRF